MDSLLSALGLALKGTAVLTMCSVAGWRLWSSMKREPAMVPTHSVPAFSSFTSETKRKKKSVRIATVKNTVHTYTPVVAKFVAFHWRHSWIEYEHQADPAGYDTLHCRKTKYIRGFVPDVELVDDDGDVAMDGF
ncbi:MAG: hypothetical protein Q9201_002088 [Fulgogasparrea decipioides]